MSKRLTRLARLATREDVLAVCGSWSLPHVHKTLALLVVYHTLHRLVLGMDGAATLPLVAALAVHLLLSLSAVVFTVPVHTKMPHVLDGLYRAQVAPTAPLHRCTAAPLHQCTDTPTRQLYRAQVLAFTARSVGVMLLVLLEPPPEPACRLHTCLLLGRLAVVAASHRAADAAQRRTVRALRDAADPHAAASTGVRRALRHADHVEEGSLESRLVAPRVDTPSHTLPSHPCQACTPRTTAWQVAPGRLFFSMAQVSSTTK